MELLLLLWLLASRAHAGCFRPNGTSRNDPSGPDTYLPCSSSTTHSMCCRTGSPSGNDVCRNDGLCKNGDLIWRESCTDRTWKADACIKLCISDSRMRKWEPLLRRPRNGATLLYTRKRRMVGRGEGLRQQPEKFIVLYFVHVLYFPSNLASPSRDYTGVIAGSVFSGIVVLAVLICFLWWLTFMKEKSHFQPTAPAELDSSTMYQIDDGAIKFAQEQQYHEAPPNTIEEIIADVPLFEVK
ncbi:hypothetical protein K505DRAFT_336583 [Melanomma pulvis-pyrius CBS 109.77]|uniref:Uncharacterized protein n=1 Tax=Melanomma pulvis-pyrius CBS 109.77 TaxID=1314802 RepID=A0A6A6XEI3_9PLEO|nr:hypothetical protein K505DRAFT_336583 [Melanomma pulvis-pyrius CBS 109.77]